MSWRIIVISKRAKLDYQLGYINESEISEWIIEAPELFSKYLETLLNQTKGFDGQFVLSNKNKELDISKNIEIILNPLTIDINDKKILGKIYGELHTLANDETMYLKTREVMGILQQYFYELEQNYNTTLVIEGDIELKELLKAMNVRIEEQSLDYFERFIQYIKLQAEVLKKKLIILVNIRSYLSHKQLEQLFQYTKYNEIPILMIESIQRDFTNETNKFIIDIDKCEI